MWERREYRLEEVENDFRYTLLLTVVYFSTRCQSIFQDRLLCPFFPPLIEIALCLACVTYVFLPVYFQPATRQQLKKESLPLCVQPLHKHAE